MAYHEAEVWSAFSDTLVVFKLLPAYQPNLNVMGWLTTIYIYYVFGDRLNYTYLQYRAVQLRILLRHLYRTDQYMLSNA